MMTNLECFHLRKLVVLSYLDDGRMYRFNKLEARGQGLLRLDIIGIDMCFEFG